MPFNGPARCGVQCWLQQFPHQRSTTPELWEDRSGLYQERVRLGIVGPRAVHRSRRERRQAARQIDRSAFETLEEVKLKPLPHYEDLTAEEYRLMVASVIEEIEKDTLLRLDVEGGRSMGREKILAQDPHAAPRQSKRSPAPGIHAYRRKERLSWFIDRWSFLVEYRRAAQRLRSGVLDAGYRVAGGITPPPGSHTTVRTVPYTSGSSGPLLTTTHLVETE